jgi:hypothetical protein
MQDFHHFVLLDGKLSTPLGFASRKTKSQELAMANRATSRRIWKESHISALRMAFKPSNLSAMHRSLVTPSVPIPKLKKAIRRALESESDAQKRLVVWFDQKEFLFYSIPNGADVSDANRKTLVAEGMRKGVPDLCFPMARGRFHGMYVEMKRSDGGSGLTVDQKRWLSRLEAEGYLAICCNGFDDAFMKISWYMGLGAFKQG